MEYSEMRGLFEEEQGLFDAITSSIEYSFDLPGNATEKDAITLLYQQADRWNQVIEKNQMADLYSGVVRRIYDVIYRTIDNLPNEEKEERYKLFNPLATWFNRIGRPQTYVEMLYFHQGIRHIKALVKMYEKKAQSEDKTSRHLFERGMRLVGLDDIRYLQETFEENCQEYYRTADYLYKKKELPKRKWVKDPEKAKKMREELYRHLKYAQRAYKKQEIKGKIVEALKPYQINFNKYHGKAIKGRFELDGDLRGYIVYRNDNTIIVGFSGTDSLKHCKTDIVQYLGKWDPVYLMAAGLVNSVWMGKSHKKGFKDSEIIVCGHSLGGGLMQFAIGVNDKENMKGYGYNSAGLTKPYLRSVWDYETEKICHLHLPLDVVFVLPRTFQIGQAVKCESKVFNLLSAHKIGVMRKQTGTYRHDYVEVI